MKILLIQTAFLGDVILATSLVEKLHHFYPESSIDFLLRKGNEQVLENHPFIEEVLIWDKKNNKYRNLFSLISRIRNKKYDYIINLQRFAASGLVTVAGNAKHTIGYDKNPFSVFFEKKIHHEINATGNKHEVERNIMLVESITDNKPVRPKLYPSTTDFDKVANFKTGDYICIAPASVWFTKQFPKEKWVELIRHLSFKKKSNIYLLGSPADRKLCDEIILDADVAAAKNLAGDLSILQTAALMKDASMNYVNDSAPLHIASAMNAPVTAIYCSTVPAFGFGPLSDNSSIVETKVKLDCRPCGLHGYASCPEGHFKCALTIDIEEVVGSWEFEVRS
ncbi:MAG: glycosyltransferase family 9 protein [Bacteroidota bacterium]